MDIGDSINVLENSLRDLVEPVLRMAHGDSWFDHLGTSEQRIGVWQARREAEPKRRSGGEVEHRLLYYADFYDVVEVVKKNWDTGFKDCFNDKKRFEVYADRLQAFRDPDAHSRALLPFEEQLVLGMTGELRQDITMFFSSGAGGPEPEHFARIEEIRDSYGTRVTGAAASGGDAKSPAILRPGDAISFVGRAWDPEGGALKWTLCLGARGIFIEINGSEIEWVWVISEQDISEHSFIGFTIESTRPYSRTLDRGDATATISYSVLPPRR